MNHSLYLENESCESYESCNLAPSVTRGPRDGGGERAEWHTPRRLRPLAPRYCRDPISSIGRVRMAAVVPAHSATSARAPIAPMMVSDPSAGSAGIG